MGLFAKKCLSIISIVTGIILFITGLVLLIVGQYMIENNVKDQVKLVNGSQSFDNWMNPAVPIYMKFHVWHIKNVDDIVYNGARPSIEERGPFTYREIREKHDVDFLKNNTLLRYRQTIAYEFEPSLSVGMDTDTFTCINLPLLVIASMKPFGIKFVWDIFIKTIFEGEKLFSDFTVKDYLFGYTDPALEKVRKEIEKLGFNGSIIPTEFGIFAGDQGNGTDDGFYTIRTGFDDVSQINIIDKWKNMTELPYWTSESCNMINGTDGTIYHPFVKKTDRLYIFSSDICRSIYVTYAGDAITRDIPMYHFTPPIEIFAAPDLNPENAGYCVPSGNCMKSGVLSIKPCKQSVPIVMSQPHFLFGDHNYTHSFEGPDPSVKHHLTYLDIEPLTGVIMNASKRLQINIMVGRRDILKHETAKLNETVWPLVWVDETAVIDEGSAELFKSKVLLPITILKYLKYVLICIGILFILIGTILTITGKSNATKEEVDEQLINSTDKDLSAIET